MKNAATILAAVLFTLAVLFASAAVYMAASIDARFWHVAPCAAAAWQLTRFGRQIVRAVVDMDRADDLAR